MLRKPCVRCGAVAVFTLLFSDPVKKGGKEKSDAPVPMVWECDTCHFIARLCSFATGPAEVHSPACRL